MKNIRIVLMGTPAFATVPFERIIKEGYNVVGLVSQPDRPVGRKKEILPTPTKELAQKYNIKVVQPEKIRSDFAEVLALEPDLIITCAYGQIVPKEVLDCPRLGCINIHGSLLPKLRGGAPVQKSIIYGEQETGITIMDMAEKMDAGDMISKASIKIEDNDDNGSLFKKLETVASDLIIKTLPSIIDGTATREKQDENLVTYAWNISKEEEKIDWSKSAKEVHNLIRGLYPAPIAYTMLKGERFKIHVASIFDSETINQDFGLAFVQNGKILVKCGTGIIEILKAQPFGKKALTSSELINGGFEGEKFI